MRGDVAEQSFDVHCASLVQVAPSANFALHVGADGAVVVSHHKVTSQMAPAAHDWPSCAG